MSNGEEEGGGLLGILVGIAGGALAGYLLARWLDGLPVPCPGCNRPIRKRVQRCPHCHVGIKWG